VTVSISEMPTNHSRYQGGVLELLRKLAREGRDELVIQLLRDPAKMAAGYEAEYGQAHRPRSQ
jgi:hypothetical protein